MVKTFLEVNTYPKNKKISDENINYNWYTNFKSNSTHYIIFYNKVFKVDRTKKEQYEEVTKYGINLGIPDYQLDFSDFIVIR